MLASSKHCKIRRTSIQSEIKFILKRNSLVVQSTHGILIGSRAARHYLPNFRGTSHDKNADWDIISSSEFFLEWLCEQGEEVKTIDMIIPKAKDRSKLDLYVYCIMQDESRYDFTIPRSSLSYTAYLLENSKAWITKKFPWTKWTRKRDCLPHASVKLLLILKKYMLYYTHQWVKTAKDYRELLTIADPLTDDDTVLCDAVVVYNEKIHGRRPLDTDEFVSMPYDAQNSTSISRNEFFQQKKDKRIALVYQAAMSMSIAGDILIGLEHICTQGPLWLADYVIDNWITLQNEKFKQKFQFSLPCIKFEVDNHRLFPQISENITQRIIQNMTDTGDFYSMQLVCKRWYVIFRQESFWRDLYLSRYGAYYGNIDTVKSWKMLYFVRLEGHLIDENSKVEQLVNATIELRQYTAKDVFKLWEDLTHRDQRIEPVFFSKIDYILSNSFYYQMDETSDEYSVRLIISGFDDAGSRSKVHLILNVGEQGSSRFTDHTEELSIECHTNDETRRSLKFFCPNLVGFDLGYWGYVSAESALLTSTSSIIFPAFPSGLLICLFITMTHPAHRTQFIKYLKSLESHCCENLSDL